MLPRKAIFLLSLLSTSVAQAHWIPFKPGPLSDPISDVRNKEIDNQQGGPWRGPPPRSSTTSTVSVPDYSNGPSVGSFPGPNMVPRSNLTSYGCTYGSSSCAHVGKPQVCCPDIIIISPAQVILESSCFKTERSTLGVICCQDPVECERVEHHPDQYPGFQLTCSSGSYMCPAKLGGGCCPDGMSCATDICYEAPSNDSYTGPTRNYQADMVAYNYMPETTHISNVARDQDCNHMHPPIGPHVQFTSGCVTPSANIQVPASTKSDIAYPTNGFGHMVRKSAPISVLKTGETEACIEPRCQDPLSGLANELDGAIQSVAGGSDVVLTLTQAIGGIATHIPGASEVLNQLDGGNNTVNIIGSLANVFKSDGYSYARSESTVWSRTFSSGHIQYMVLALILHGVIEMRLNRRI